MAENSTTVLAAGDWLDSSGTWNSVNSTTTSTVTNWCWGCNCWPCHCHHDYHYHYNTYSTPHRPIRISVGELDVLRKAAKGNRRLKAVLEKFTDQVEVEVSFD
jgi:hypothetical protein